MRIGVDIDGVLNYRQEFVVTYGTKFCHDTGKGRLTRLESHHLCGMFGWDLETRDEFWNTYGYIQLHEWPAVMFAAEVIKKLHDEGHEIWIITGRDEGDTDVVGRPKGMTWEEVTIDWLRNNGIIFDAMGFNVQEKGRFCLENGIDVMIEDNPDYLGTFDGEVKVLVFDQPYNRGIDLKNSERVYSWHDVYDRIKECE